MFSVFICWYVWFFADHGWLTLTPTPPHPLYVLSHYKGSSLRALCILDKRLNVNSVWIAGVEGKRRWGIWRDVFSLFWIAILEWKDSKERNSLSLFELRELEGKESEGFRGCIFLGLNNNFGVEGFRRTEFEGILFLNVLMDKPLQKWKENSFSIPFPSLLNKQGKPSFLFFLLLFSSLLPPSLLFLFLLNYYLNKV